MTPEETCPCSSSRTYLACCGPLLEGRREAETAEQLMRSRYTAFARGHLDYLIATLHPSKRRPDERTALAQSIAQTDWLRLEVLKVQQGAPTDEVGYVEFVAYYEQHGVQQLRERSRFVKEEGQWFYVDGALKAPRKVGRNEPCWCGSGKKYKRCHGR